MDKEEKKSITFKVNVDTRKARDFLNELEILANKYGITITNSIYENGQVSIMLYSLIEFRIDNE